MFALTPSSFGALAERPNSHGAGGFPAPAAVGETVTLAGGLWQLCEALELMSVISQQVTHAVKAPSCFPGSCI